MKKIFVALCSLAIAGSMIGCSKTETVEKDSSQVVNPISEVDKSEFEESVGFEIGIPENAEDVKWLIYVMDGSEETLGEVQYTLDGKEYVQRAMVTDKTSMDDIDDDYITSFTGYYYEWKDVSDVDIQNRSGKAMSCDEAKVVVWLDAVPGIIYDIATTDSSVTTDDLVSIANETFIPTQQES